MKAFKDVSGTLTELKRITFEDETGDYGYEGKYIGRACYAMPTPEDVLECSEEKYNYSGPKESDEESRKSFAMMDIKEACEKGKLCYAKDEDGVPQKPHPICISHNACPVPGSSIYDIPHDIIDFYKDVRDMIFSLKDIKQDTKPRKKKRTKKVIEKEIISEMRKLISEYNAIPYPASGDGSNSFSDSMPGDEKNSSKSNSDSMSCDNKLFEAFKKELQKGGSGNNTSNKTQGADETSKKENTNDYKPSTKGATQPDETSNEGATKPDETYNKGATKPDETYNKGNNQADKTISTADEGIKLKHGEKMDKMHKWHDVWMSKEQRQKRINSGCEYYRFYGFKSDFEYSNEINQYKKTDVNELELLKENYIKGYLKKLDKLKIFNEEEKEMEKNAQAKRNTKEQLETNKSEKPANPSNDEKPANPNTKAKSANSNTTPEQNKKKNENQSTGGILYEDIQGIDLNCDLLDLVMVKKNSNIRHQESFFYTKSTRTLNKKIIKLMNNLPIGNCECRNYVPTGVFEIDWKFYRLCFLNYKQIIRIANEKGEAPDLIENRLRKLFLDDFYDNFSGDFIAYREILVQFDKLYRKLCKLRLRLGISGDKILWARAILLKNELKGYDYTKKQLLKEINQKEYIERDKISRIGNKINTKLVSN